MPRNEKISKALATLASRLLKHPDQATNADVKKLAASVVGGKP